MSITERFSRIVRHKLNEFKDRLEEMDEEALREREEDLKRVRSRVDARRELEDSASEPTPAVPSGSASAGDTRGPDLGGRPNFPAQAPPRSVSPAPANRAPQTGSGANASSVYGSGGSGAQTAASDPLAEHYRLLGVPPGSDFVTVQAHYNALAARLDPIRFPAGSPDAQTAQDIRTRLDASYKVLRDALDVTARRFDLLEFDAPAPPRSETNAASPLGSAAPPVQRVASTPPAPPAGENAVSSALPAPAAEPAVSPALESASMSAPEIAPASADDPTTPPADAKGG